VNTPFASSAVLDEVLAALETLSNSVDLPSLVLSLRKRFPELDPQALNMAAEIFVARRSAPQKLGDWARGGYFSLAVLQQASRSAIAEHRAQGFRGSSHVLEIGTGSGSDTAALAAVCGKVTTLEADPATSELARRNLELRGISNVTFIVGTAEEVLQHLEGSFDALFADPARRSREGDRIKEASDYSPPLDFVMKLSIGHKRAIKVSPGLFIDAPSLGWSREFVGYGSECLEQTLWYGTDTIDSSVFVADIGKGWSPSRAVHPLPHAESLEGFIIEAHAVVNRSQEVGRFFAERGIRQIAPDVAYGISSEEPTPDPLLTSFRILDAFPYHLKTLKLSVKSLRWSRRTELKKRTCPLDLEEVRAALPLEEHSHEAPFGVLFFFRWRSATWVLLAERVRE
jgi:SAM-dependent methyltransferase